MFTFCFLRRGDTSVRMQATGEAWEIFVMKGSVKCKAVIYNIQNLEFETTEFRW